ncbi:MAG: polymerase sigma-70 factor, subfamily [Acidobacteria bacterium]|nr:polymerase sigma-70 factor, subfamily [Acidobacteriota bacterium]
MVRADSIAPKAVQSCRGNCNARWSEAGLTQIDALLDHGELANYYLGHSARADMYRRLGRTAEARSSMRKPWR